MSTESEKTTFPGWYAVSWNPDVEEYFDADGRLIGRVTPESGRWKAAAEGQHIGFYYHKWQAKNAVETAPRHVALGIPGPLFG
jgi:hypothetical protein